MVVYLMEDHAPGGRYGAISHGSRLEPAEQVGLAGLAWDDAARWHSAALG